MLWLLFFCWFTRRHKRLVTNRFDENRISPAYKQVSLHNYYTNSHPPYVPVSLYEWPNRIKDRRHAHSDSYLSCTYVCIAWSIRRNYELIKLTCVASPSCRYKFDHCHCWFIYGPQAINNLADSCLSIGPRNLTTAYRSVFMRKFSMVLSPL